MLLEKFIEENKSKENFTQLLLEETQRIQNLEKREKELEELRVKKIENLEKNIQVFRTQKEKEKEAYQSYFSEIEKVSPGKFQLLENMETKQLTASIYHDNNNTEIVKQIDLEYNTYKIVYVKNPEYHITVEQHTVYSRHSFSGEYKGWKMLVHLPHVYESQRYLKSASTAVSKITDHIDMIERKNEAKKQQQTAIQKAYAYLCEKFPEAEIEVSKDYTAINRKYFEYDVVKVLFENGLLVTYRSDAKSICYVSKLDIEKLNKDKVVEVLKNI